MAVFLLLSLLLLLLLFLFFFLVTVSLSSPLWLPKVSYVIISNAFFKKNSVRLRKTNLRTVFMNATRQRKSIVIV